MSTSRLVDGPFLKLAVAINGLVPAVLLAWDAAHGQLGVNQVNFAIRTTGMLGLVFLVLSLAITPLRRLTGWNLLIAPRRQLGLLAFFYIAAHFAIFWLYDRAGSIGDTFAEILARSYLWFGFGALLVMIPLAVTSTDAMVARLGGKRWKHLHRLAYVAGIGGVIHYYMLVKSDVRLPVLFAIVLGVLLLSRLIPKRKPKRAFWSGELVVTEIRAETADVKTFRFALADGTPLPFTAKPGQYLNLSLSIDGARVNRSYTIANSDRRWCEITVKKIGVASHHLHDVVKIGDRVKIGAPAGRFVFTGDDGDQVVLIAGGVGITPMMAVIRSLTARRWRGAIYLLYSVRTAADVIFADELARLAAAHPNLHVEIVISSERGHITEETIRRCVPAVRGRVMLCGPDAMMDAMRAHCTALGFTDVTQEAFVSPLRVSAAPSASAGVPDANANVQFQRAGKRAPAAELTILEVAEDCGVAIAYECRSGICGQCKTRLVSGKVTMEVQDALTPGDRAKGLILACQARAADDVVVDA